MKTARGILICAAAAAALLYAASPALAAEISGGLKTYCDAPAGVVEVVPTPPKG